ncbi:DUF4340 domain-containing protein [Anaeromyxobacter diazotrophicus]|uniref:DUF4340 domain-containing protein n=1 Tax=Anaeromyxobacter diazotrophicus TaxID=2590199 RepID=A0A7I9VH04_9BACT|nr:DUF4340 domain-containing protein [Anaeromyxobacter diazotrophicus]GEJ55529.1 hypothetical protein AMYX_02700 [Anaeromyxobacter diazotrophicus]
MTSRARSLLSAFALLAVAAGAVAFAWFGVARKDEAAAARKAAGQRLFAFEPAQVKALTLRAKGTTTALARAGDGWRLEGERPAPAQRRVVEGLLEAVAGLQKKAVLSPADGPALEQYGLAAPEAQLTLTLDGGRQVELALGGENAYDGTRFVRTGDGTVALVDGGVAWRLTRDRQAFEQPPPPPPSPDAGVDAGRPPP